MHGTMIVIKTDGAMTDPKSLTGPPELADLQSAVGGYLELVPYFDSIEHNGLVARCVVFCNEHGKLDGLPFNGAATRAWDAALTRNGQYRYGDLLVGDVAVLFGDREFMAAL